jgi:hypothetical protein
MIAVVAAVIVAVMAVIMIVVVFCFSVRDLGVDMASKCINYSLSLIGTRIVFVSSICRRNSSVFH